MELCSECMKKYGEEVGKKHPSLYYEFDNSASDKCCNDPSDCADYQSGKCPGDVQKD